jgi:hypothetical protein
MQLAFSNITRINEILKFCLYMTVLDRDMTLPIIRFHS